MGYETKLFVCIKRDYEEEVFEYESRGSAYANTVYRDKEDDKPYYFSGPNTKTYLTRGENPVKSSLHSVIAMIDLCNTGGSSYTGRLMREKRQSEIIPVIYDFHDGNRYISEDTYGEHMKEHSPEEIVEALRKDNANGDVYRRFRTALVLIEDVMQNYTTDDISVLSYGY